HQAEVGFVTTDDAGLQPLRSAVSRRVENLQGFISSGANVFWTKVSQHAAVKAVVKMRAMPTFGGLEADGNRLRSGRASGGHSRSEKSEGRRRMLTQIYRRGVLAR